MIAHTTGAVLGLILSILSSASAVDLPDTFTTTKGQIISRGRIIMEQMDAVKVLHDGGVTLIPLNQLPAEIKTLLGIGETKSEEEIKLPELLTLDGKDYNKPLLLAIEPDGIRVQHSNGTAKLKYEKLEPSLQKLLGGFDAVRAADFRTAEMERQKQALASIAEAKEMERAINSGQVSASPPSIDGNASPKLSASSTDAEEMAGLASDPSLISRVVNVRLTGRSEGGKSRETSWQTDYGSFARRDTSSRRFMCQVTSTGSKPQRARIQALWLTRSMANGTLGVAILEDAKVNLAVSGSATVGAVGEVVNVDEKFVMLGTQVRTGNKYIGWVWRAIDGQGRVCAVTSSIPSYDHYGWETPLETSG